MARSGEARWFGVQVCAGGSGSFRRNKRMWEGGRAGETTELLLLIHCLLPSTLPSAGGDQGQICVDPVS